MKSILLVVLAVLLMSPAWADSGDRYYLFVGEPSPTAWQWLMKNPSDREAVAKDGIEKLGGEMLSYYFGMNNAKNYITVRLPADNKTVPALLIMRLSSGLLVSYEAIELMPSGHMPLVMERVEEIMAVDDIQSSELEDAK